MERQRLKMDGKREREKIVPGIQTKKDGEIENINRDREKQKETDVDSERDRDADSEREWIQRQTKPT